MTKNREWMESCISSSKTTVMLFRAVDNFVIVLIIVCGQKNKLMMSADSQINQNKQMICKGNLSEPAKHAGTHHVEQPGVTHFP